MHEANELEAVMAVHADHPCPDVARQLATAKRVAEEAMRLMSPEQLAELRHRMDALEAGEG